MYFCVLSVCPACVLLQLCQPITGCASPTLTTRAGTTLAFIARACQTTRPTCSAVTTITPLSNTAATRPSSRQSCSSTSPPPQMDTLTSEFNPNDQRLATYQSVRMQKPIKTHQHYNTNPLKAVLPWDSPKSTVIDQSEPASYGSTSSQALSCLDSITLIDSVCECLLTSIHTYKGFHNRYGEDQILKGS